MEFIKTKCRKCGYELEIPDKTESVICGSCGEINHFTRLSAILRKHGDSSPEIKWGDKNIDNRKSGGMTSPGKQIPRSQEEDKLPVPEEDKENFPEQGPATKILTLIFIIAPFIAIAVEHFKLPSYVAVIVIAAIILLLFILKKRS